MKQENVIEILEDVQLPNSDVILEKGDKIKVLTERNPRIMSALENLLEEMTDINDHTGAELVEAIVTADVRTAEKIFSRWVKRETQGFLTAGDY